MSNKQKNLISGIGAIVVMATLFLLTSCGSTGLTVIPKTVTTTQASFSGNSQNSHLESVNSTGFSVDADWINTYDALLVIYGDRFIPAVKAGDRKGITAEGDKYRITGEINVRYGKMARWARNDQAKSKVPEQPKKGILSKIL